MPRLHCNNCNHSFHIDAGIAGQRGFCPRCRNEIPIVSASKVAASPSMRPSEAVAWAIAIGMTTVTLVGLASLLSEAPPVRKTHSRLTLEQIREAIPAANPAMERVVEVANDAVRIEYQSKEVGVFVQLSMPDRTRKWGVAIYYEPVDRMHTKAACNYASRILGKPLEAIENWVIASRSQKKKKYFYGGSFKLRYSELDTYHVISIHER